MPQLASGLEVRQIVQFRRYLLFILSLQEEIAALCEIPGVRARRARLLFQAGYITVEQVAHADVHNCFMFSDRFRS